MAVENHTHIHQSSQRGATVNVINLFHFFFKGATELSRPSSKLHHKSAPAAISSD